MKQVAVAIIKNAQDEYLFVASHKIFGEHTGKYYPPGGSLEPAETPEDAVVRELWEELGAIVIPQQRITVTPGDVPDQMTYWIACELITDPDDFKIETTELAGIAWVTRENMRLLPVWPATEKFFAQYIDEPHVSRERGY